jgi:hypothetical protein
MSILLLSCDRLGYSVATLPHLPSGGCGPTGFVETVSDLLIFSDQLHERELVTLNADLLAFPKLTRINIHALASLSGKKDRSAPGWPKEMWLASSHLRRKGGNTLWRMP